MDYRIVKYYRCNEMGRIDRVIISAYGNMYEHFTAPVSMVWEFLFSTKVSSFAVPEIEGIPRHNVAKCLRWIVAGEYSDDYVLITDADMLPLNKEYFQQCAKHAEPDKILFFTSELEGEDKGKFPACYTMATGATFKRHINPEDKPIDELLHSWDFGPMANPSVLPFSDESLMKFLFADAPKICLERHHQHRRLCRSNWNPDPEKLASHWYIDCHMPRPFHENMDKLKPVFESIGIRI